MLKVKYSIKDYKNFHYHANSGIFIVPGRYYVHEPTKEYAKDDGWSIFKIDRIDDTGMVYLLKKSNDKGVIGTESYIKYNDDYWNQTGKWRYANAEEIAKFKQDVESKLHDKTI